MGAVLRRGAAAAATWVRACPPTCPAAHLLNLHVMKPAMRRDGFPGHEPGDPSGLAVDAGSLSGSPADGREIRHRWFRHVEIHEGALPVASGRNPDASGATVTPRRRCRASSTMRLAAAAAIVEAPPPFHCRSQWAPPGEIQASRRSLMKMPVTTKAITITPRNRPARTRDGSPDSRSGFAICRADW
ncbi:MAG: hypothetical protein JWN62_2604 [Acidimicrobiales bacterium]|nr:hypothetical protein [Acidimicrobiales bacterium]